MHLGPGFITTTLLITALTACSQPEGGGSGRSGADDPLYRLTGTVAIGRPGAWSEVCIEADCSRANHVGVYRLLAERRRSALMHATIENADQSTVNLTSLYRHQPAQTVSLININPTTDALLDSWSQYQQGETLDDCSTNETCRDALISSFTPALQQAAQAQLQAWLAPEWETARSPYTDPYIADPDLDWLDALHDHVQLAATPGGLSALDNDADTLATLAYDTLFDDTASLIPIGRDALANAFSIPPTIPTDNNPISIDYQATPSSPFTAPQDWQVDVSGSRSDILGNLSFQHTLVSPDGRVSTGLGSLFSATLTDPGPYTWTVVATDSEGNQATDGLALQANASDVISQPSFGAEGSCSTSPLTANASNICISTVDGGSLGACVADNSGSTQTRFSPAPCSPVSQQGGVFLGTCTSVLNQVRVYHYDNPRRNTGETLTEQRTRLRNQCVNNLGRDWSGEPPA
ncbi:hypothetical protein [Saccharospirillum impatiens]|uniref:hypothetical protein n=1 Tax=Saccharospirillum impatiens TaxID=169438 RepID=UPI000422D654|nr:hypothetical protein [Saccharospirillum impatiens]